MASITWSTPPMQIAARLEGKVNRTEDQLIRLVQGVVDDGADQMRQFILLAVTKTGEERVRSGRGGEAGRYESGTMYDSVESNVSKERGEIVGEFGWLDEFLEYFRIQEEGRGGVPAMHALHDAYANASEEFKAEVHALIRSQFG